MDINISANTLFHFTSSRQFLLSILSNGLYARYSLENFESLINDTAELVFPMTCFCDIPLSQVKRHTNIYGKYAIGLTKKWGMENKINPVIYTYPNSTTADLLNSILSELGNFFNIEEEHKPKKIRRKKPNSGNDFYFDLQEILKDPTFKYKAETAQKIQELNEQLGYFLKYIKPYEGKFYRNNDYLENSVKFYEEREWRFIPDRKSITNAKLKDSFKAEYYKNPVKRRAINIKLSKHSKLVFKPNDIRFIIVQKDNEIPEMLNELEKIFGSTASYKDLKLLGTRLISIEQIIEDI
jgi:hypothetical protein